MNSSIDTGFNQENMMAEIQAKSKKDINRSYCLSSARSDWECKTILDDLLIEIDGTKQVRNNKNLADIPCVIG